MPNPVGRPRIKDYKESFYDKIMKEAMDKFKKDVEAQERFFWGLVDIDRKEREDIKSGKQIHFKGFINLINIKDAPNKDI